MTLQSNAPARVQSRTRARTRTVAHRSRPPAGPFGPRRTATAGGFDPHERRLLRHLDGVLADPSAHPPIPRAVSAFDSRLGRVRQVRWTDPREPLALRRTAVALAEAEYFALRPGDFN